MACCTPGRCFQDLAVRWAMALLPDGRQVFVPGAIITPLGRWRSPTTGVVYPSGWRVRVPGLRLDVVVRPTVRDQEMAGSLAVSGYRSSYWEGSGTVAGTRAGHRVLQAWGMDGYSAKCVPRAFVAAALLTRTATVTRSA